MTEPPQSVLEYGHGFAPRRGNASAVVSLIFGLLGCIPLISGLIATIFGIVGLRNARDPAVSGKGMAIAGLTLGLISLLVWGTFGSILSYGYLQSRRAGAIEKIFLQEITAGNANAASANSVGLTAAQLQTDIQQMHPFGTLQSIHITSFNFSRGHNSPPVMHLVGTATFTNGQKNCTFDLIKQGTTYKVKAYTVQ